MTTNPRIPFAFSSDRPTLPPPGGKPLIVQVVVNIENWRFDQPMPRKLLTAPHGVETTPDVPNFAWAEYGLRCGLPRMMRMLERRDIAVGCALNAAVIDTYPRVAEAILDAGWEVIGHGLHQKSVQAEASESEILEMALSKLQAFSGQRVQGWLGPGLKETEHTVDLLKAHGLRYCSDWVLDDLPTWMRTTGGPMIAMPYSLEINDSVAHAVQARPSDELLTRLRLTLQTFEDELADQPRVLTLGLHPHLMGVPHRAPILDAMLEMLQARDDVVFMTGAQIADWFESVCPVPEAI
ncbi:MAG: polysaccharide deacetylase family protein [Phenylobacterium sp.]|nr:polysaccharide deacetylase family protein [Phenylobacterium sp.]